MSPGAKYDQIDLQTPLDGDDHTRSSDLRAGPDTFFDVVGVTRRAAEAEVMKEVVRNAKRNGRQVHSASLLDLSPLTNTEIADDFQKYTGVRC